MLLAFIGCGGGNSSTTKAIEQDVPKAPVLDNKEKVPPSIPTI